MGNKITWLILAIKTKNPKTKWDFSNPLSWQTWTDEYASIGEGAAVQTIVCTKQSANVDQSMNGTIWPRNGPVTGIYLDWINQKWDHK